MRKKLLLIAIIITAFLLRVYKINLNPPSLSWDEVSIGYNAYSILKTGKDEHGRFLPLDTFIAYGDYKPPIPVYITVPFVAVFGLNETAVRLPVALFGTVTVGLTYLLVLELFHQQKHRQSLALLSSAILAFSPWHLNLSRVGFEAVIALCFIILSVVVFLKARNKKEYFYFAFIPLVAAIYTFNSARYFAPFLGIVLLVFVKQKALAAKKQIVSGIVIAVLLLLPILPHLISPEARLRFKEVNIFSDVDIVKLANKRAETAGNTWLAKLVYNRRVFYGLAFLKHYLDNFEPRFLFIQGDGNPKFSIQDVGQLYIVEAPLLIIGIVALLIEFPSIGIFLLLWLGLAIVPAATARETPHALRILNTLPTWQIFISYGVIYIVEHLNSKQIRQLFSVATIGLYAFFIIFYLHTYYVHYPVEYSGEWQYGYREAFQYAESVKDQYDRIVVSDVIGRPYAYALFYGAYDPNEFLETKQSGFDAAGFYNVSGFGKYQFIRQNTQDLQAKTLYILAAGSKPEGATEVFHVDLLNGTPDLVGFHI